MSIGPVRHGRALLTAIVCVAAAPGLVTGQWPQWRGPSMHGVSAETGLPTTWNTKQNVAWRAPLAGLGTSSPIVWNDRVIVTSQTGSIDLARGGAHPQLARDDRALAA